METLRHVVLLVHLLGFAVLFGSWAVQAFGGRREFATIMEYGLLIAGIAGLVLAAPWGLPDGSEMNYVKIGTKLVVLVVIGGLVGTGLARQKRDATAPPPGLFWLVGVLTALNAGIAVLWT